MSKELPKGFACETCGKFHSYSLYVYAHVRDVLKHVCDNCGAKHSIVNLSAKQTAKGRVPKRTANG